VDFYSASHVLSATHAPVLPKGGEVAAQDQASVRSVFLFKFAHSNLLGSEGDGEGRVNLSVGHLAGFVPLQLALFLASDRLLDLLVQSLRIDAGARLYNDVDYSAFLRHGGNGLNPSIDLWQLSTSYED